jgi:hypothetical protein
MRSFAIITLLLCHAAIATAAEFRHVGDFLLKAHFKMTGSEMTPIPMKPIAFRVSTDGVTIRISLEDEEESHTSFQIYRSDGIGRQRAGAGALEVIPGVQASSTKDGTLRHLRLSRESLTITTFPGVSDQTIVSHAVAAEPKEPQPVAKP